MTDPCPAAAADADPVPYCVPPGWLRCDRIDNPDTAAYRFRLLWWSDTEIGFEHLCDRDERGTIVCAPLLAIGSGHQVSMVLGRSGLLRPTVTPSILCDDCGLHGFVTAGRWQSA